MKILTYNLWHGLTPSSAISMEHLEPEARRRTRLMMQLRLLSELDFDLGLFQEVNPLLERVSQIERETGLHGCFQSDLVGVKVLGVGIPNTLNSGLFTAAKDQYQLRRVKGIKLSGAGRSFVSPWLSFQLKEERYALFSEFIHSQWGRVLVVNAHLHHGLELTEGLTQELKAAVVEYGLSSSVESELFERLHKGNERRLKEMKRLMDEVQRMSERYSVVIVGGDFNSRPDGEVGQLLKEYGFVDSFSMQSSVPEAFTYQREGNLANHRLQARFPLSVQFEDLSFSKKVTLALQEILTRHEQSSRRIDQIWVRSLSGARVDSGEGTEQSKGIAEKSSGVAPTMRSSVSLVGFEGDEGFAPSDHFGYLVELTRG